MTTTAPPERPRERRHPSALRYVAVWIGLLALTATSYGSSRLHLGNADIVIALLIASVKTSLVLLFFMHLVERPGTAMLVPFIGVAFVGLLVSLVVTDVSTRHTFPPAPLPLATEGAMAPAPPAGGKATTPPATSR